MPKQNDALELAGPVSRQLYKEVVAALKPIGAFREEVKKTSVHLVRNSAFAGVHPRKEHLILTIKAEKPIRSARIFKAEQVSKNRWHLEVKLSASKEIDRELIGWLREAYDLCA
jgi:hypothetical protein